MKSFVLQGSIEGSENPGCWDNCITARAASYDRADMAVELGRRPYRAHLIWDQAMRVSRLLLEDTDMVLVAESRHEAVCIHTCSGLI